MASKKVRSPIVKAKIEKWIETHGGDGAAEAVFIKRAATIATSSRVRRPWRTKSKTQEQSARESLDRLFGRRVSPDGTTGVNENWILDIWEASLEDETTTPLLKRSSASTRQTGVRPFEDELSETPSLRDKGIELYEAIAYDNKETMLEVARFLCDAA